jgi:hypothetical protein
MFFNVTIVDEVEKFIKSHLLRISLQIWPVEVPVQSANRAEEPGVLADQCHHRHRHHLCHRGTQPLGREECTTHHHN